MNRLTSRERILVAVVIGIVLVLGNLLLGSALLKRHDFVRASLVRKQTELKSLQALVADRALWAEREAWLNEKQPKLTNREQARVALLDEVKAAARSHNVLLENPSLGSIDTQPSAQSVTVQVETKSAWADLLGFLNTLQQPDHFIVFETANLQVDASDPTRMRGRFRIAKWYAP
jgi:hypothetical protein